MMGISRRGASRTAVRSLRESMMKRALGLFGNSFLRLLLCADKQDGFAIGNQLLHELIRFIEARHRLLQVNDMDAIAIHKDEWLHLGVPATGLVTEVYAGFKKLLHGNDVRQKQILLRSQLDSMKGPSTGPRAGERVYLIDISDYTNYDCGKMSLADLEV